MNDIAPLSPPLAYGELDRAAEEASALARDRAATTEQERRLPDELVSSLQASGLLRAGAPAALGAVQAPPAVTLRCAETVARGDASAGWCVSIAATSSLLSAYLPADGAAEIFGAADAVAAGVWAPRGTARPVDGGMRVSGHWAMAVGIRLKLAGATAEQADKLNAAIDPDGNPPDGLIFHASGPLDGGWGVLDFWESRGHFDRFGAERIGPAMAAIGATGAPDIHEFPVHEHFPR